MEEKSWKIYKEEFIEATKNFGIGFAKFLWKTGIFIGMSVWTGFTWLANIRLKIPRGSLLIEMAIFAIPVVYYYSQYVIERDASGARSYKISLRHEQELIKEEFSGFLRGKKTVLDSLEQAKAKAEEDRRMKEAQWRAKVAKEKEEEKIANPDTKEE